MKRWGKSSLVAVGHKEVSIELTDVQKEIALQVQKQWCRRQLPSEYNHRTECEKLFAKRRSVYQHAYTVVSRRNPAQPRPCEE
jgi:hypothetical protein